MDLVARKLCSVAGSENSVVWGGLLRADGDGERKLCSDALIKYILKYES